MFFYFMVFMKSLFLLCCLNKLRNSCLRALNSKGCAKAEGGMKELTFGQKKIESIKKPDKRSIPRDKAGQNDINRQFRPTCEFCNNSPQLYNTFPSETTHLCDIV